MTERDFMRYRLFFLLIGLLILTAGVTGWTSLQLKSQSTTALAAAKPRPLQIDDDEYAVYSALINDDLKDSDSDNKSSNKSDRVLIIEQRPSLWGGSIPAEENQFFEELKKSAPELQPETINDLLVKSNAVTLLERKFNIKIKYALVSNEELDALFKEDVGGGWEAFHKKFPKSSGILTLSRVGFNADKTQALVYKGWSCGGLCGGGGYTLLKKKKGVWVVDRGVGPEWVS